MVAFNYASKEMNVKIVYYGPALSGKTTNLQFIHKSIDVSKRGELTSLATQTDRTLFFDLLPIEAGKFHGYKARFLLYTVPGQVFYNATRKVVLTGADAIVFVADSQKDRMEANKEAYRNMLSNMQELNMNVNEMPLVIQYNKRDLVGTIASIEELNNELNKRNAPYFEAIAINGKGVSDTLQGIIKLLNEDIRNKIKLGRIKISSARKKFITKSKIENEEKSSHPKIRKLNSTEETETSLKPKKITLEKNVSEITLTNTKEREISSLEHTVSFDETITSDESLSNDGNIDPTIEVAIGKKSIETTDLYAPEVDVYVTPKIIKKELTIPLKIKASDLGKKLALDLILHFDIRIED